MVGTGISPKRLNGQETHETSSAFPREFKARPLTQMAQMKDRNMQSVGRHMEQPDLLHPAGAGAGTGLLRNSLEKSIKAAHMHTPDSRAYIHPRNACTPPREMHIQSEKCINILPRKMHTHPPREMHIRPPKRHALACPRQLYLS